MSGATPEWAELMQRAVEAHAFELHTSMPGQVVRVLEGANKRQFVDVQPCLRRALPVDQDDPESTTTEPFVEEDLPVLQCVPVGFIQGGGFFMSVPLKVGDFVKIDFCERSIDRWIETASKANPRTVSTGDVGVHPLEGAIAIPCGPSPRADLLQDVSGDDLVIGYDGGALLRVKSDGTIHVVGDIPPARSDKLANELERIRSDIDTLKSAVSQGLFAVGIGTAANGTTAQSTFDGLTLDIPSSPGDTAAEKVFVE